MSLKLCLVTLLTLASIGQVAARPVADDDISKPTSVEKLFYRQTPVQRSCQTDTFLVGDGDPHQNSYEIQVTETIDCGAGGAGCSVSRLNSHTVSWTASATVNIGSWFSGGFAVTEAVTSGGTYTCNGDPKQKICVWASVPFTAYTVYNKVGGVYCGEEYETEPYVLKSPNESGLLYYCVQDSACRNDGDGYWINEGRAGGP